MLNSSPIKQALIQVVAEQVMELKNKRDEAPYTDNIARYQYYDGQIEGTYTLARKLGVLSFEVDDYIEEYLNSIRIRINSKD